MNFNPKQEYGHCVRCADIQEALKRSHEDARQHLPTGTPYEIRGRLHDSDSYELAWYYQPYMSKEAETVEPQRKEMDNHVYYGRFLA